MAGFLSGLGAFAEGFAPGLDKLYQQQSDNALGNALASIYGSGTTTPQQSAGPLGSISTLLQGLGGGQAPAPQASMIPAMQQPVAQTGARMPQPQQQAPPQIVQPPTPPPPVAQAPPPPIVQPPTPPPPVAQPGVQAPGAAPQVAPQAKAPQPQQQPQPQPQAIARPQPQPQAQPQQGTGPLDIPTLVRSLTEHGITGHKLVNALHTAVPLLNAQGLAQYRDLGLQLRREHEQNMEADREFNRDPNAQGSRAQSRMANQGIAVQRMEGIQQRFQARMAAAADKLAGAKTDKQALEAKRDMDKIAAELKGELASELSIANGINTSPEEQKAALAKAAEIRQQMEQATNDAVKAHRSGGASGDQVGGISGAEKSAPPAPNVAYGPDGKRMKYKGTGDRSDPANWAPDNGG